MSDILKDFFLLLIRLFFSMALFSMALTCVFGITRATSRMRLSEALEGVKFAQNLLYVQIIKNCIYSAVFPVDLPGGVSTFLFVHLFYALLAWQVGQSKNWARWVQLIVVELGIISSIGTVFVGFLKMSFWTMLFYIFTFGLPLVAVATLFASPVKESFDEKSNAKWRYVVVGAVLNIAYLVSFIF